MRVKLTFIAVLMALGLQAQTIEELNSLKAEKSTVLKELKGQVGAIEGDIASINDQIKKLQGWRYGFSGVLGASFGGNENWFAIDQPFARSRSYGASVGISANKDRPKYFWNNLLTANYQEAFTKVDEDAEEVQATTDALDFSSLVGYKLNPKLAISAEARYQSTLMRFNDPGKLVGSAGITWLPIDNLVVIAHPLGYELNFPSGDYVSAPGAKIGATYSRTIGKVSWSSNLNIFTPYTGGEATLTNDAGEEIKVDYGAGDLFNWTWINGFSTNIWKGIGVGLNVGLRGDKQLADRYSYKVDGTESDNPIQLYYNLGLSYTL